MGYFLIMIAFMVVAIVRARNGNPWIWYGIGVVLQLISLIGLSRRYSIFGVSDSLTGTWVAFFAIALLSLFIIIIRKKS